MTKVPRAGNVKTRLQNFLSPDERAALSEAFLLDALGKAKLVCDETIVAFFPANEAEKLKKLLPDEEQIVAQRGDDLGERMRNAFDFAFSRRFETIVMIGTDSPTFPVDYIEQAFEFLETNSDVCLGRTEDGGFYLIGLRVLRPEIFDGVRWSTPQTFEQVYRNIQRMNLHLRETPGWYDVDEEQDLIKLQNEFLHNQNAQRRAPHTFVWMKTRVAF